MTKKVYSNYDLMKTVFKEAPMTWNNRVSLASRDAWEKTVGALTLDENIDIANQVYNALVNRIALVIAVNKTINNPLAKFKRGMIKDGEFIEQFAVGIASSHRFTGKAEDQFEKFANEVKATYFRENRKEYYAVTIEEHDLRKAFLTEQGGLQTFIGQVADSMVMGNTNDEYEYTKRMLLETLKGKNLPLQAYTQIVDIPDIINNPTDTNIKKALKIIKNVIENTQNNTQYFNQGKLTTSVIKNGLTMYLNPEIQINIDVDTLSNAFNSEKLKIGLTVDQLPTIAKTDTGDIIGAILDNNALGIWDTERTTRQATNARGLYTNTFFHIHQIYAMTPYLTQIFLRIPNDPSLVEAGIEYRRELFTPTETITLVTA